MMIPRFWMIGVVVALVPLTSRADEPQEKLQIVTPRDNDIIATGINGQGDFVGFEWVENPKIVGLVEQLPILVNGKSIVRLPLLKGYTATFPAAISDSGVVVGRASKPAPQGVTVPLRNQAFVWEASKGMQGLGVLAGDLASFASDITRDGRRISGFSVGENRVRPCYWESAGSEWKITSLPLEGQLGANTVAMSDDGRWLASVDGEKPCIWRQATTGEWTHEFIGESGSMVPRGVNNSGTVVGVRFTLDGLSHAVMWTSDQGLAVLPKTQGYVKSEANAVNNAGVVVGLIDGPGGSKIGPNAFVYKGGRIRIITEGGPNLTSAADINDGGQVVGVFEKPEEEEESARAEPEKGAVKAPLRP